MDRRPQFAAWLVRRYPAPGAEPLAHSPPHLGSEVRIAISLHCLSAGTDIDHAIALLAQMVQLENDRGGNQSSSQTTTRKDASIWPLHHSSPYAASLRTRSSTCSGSWAIRFESEAIAGAFVSSSDRRGGSFDVITPQRICATRSARLGASVPSM